MSGREDARTPPTRHTPTPRPAGGLEQAVEQEAGECRYPIPGGENPGQPELQGRWTSRCFDFRPQRPAVDRSPNRCPVE